MSMARSSAARAGWLGLVVGTACFHAAAVGAAELVESLGGRATLGGHGIARGIARVNCRTDEPGVWRQSRVFVIDTGDVAPSHDLLVAVAHGLPEDTRRVVSDCAVYGVNGPPAAIAAVWRPHGPRALRDDWAILATVAPLEGEVGRLRMAVLAPEALAALLSDEVPIKLVLYSDASGFDDCSFLGVPWIGSESLARGIFAHSCRTRPGLSGSPIVIGIAGEPIVVGVNVGRKMRPPELEGPLFYGIARAIDDEIESTVRRAAERLAARGDSRVAGR